MKVKFKHSLNYIIRADSVLFEVPVEFLFYLMLYLFLL